MHKVSWKYFSESNGQVNYHQATHSSTSEETTRLVESVSSYCLDLNLGENSARLIKTAKAGIYAVIIIHHRHYHSSSSPSSPFIIIHSLSSYAAAGYHSHPGHTRYGTHLVCPSRCRMTSIPFSSSWMLQSQLYSIYDYHALPGALPNTWIP